MNIAFYGYRDWALRIKKNLEDYGFKISPLDDRPSIVLYYGWSKRIPKKIYSKRFCFILHPSPLPKYRGGSPLQHQIMNGEKMSAVTICRVTDKLDAGAIYSQTPFSLEGTLDDIFERIVEIGTRDTIEILKRIEKGVITCVSQNESKATYFKRRKPKESELTIKDFKTKTAKELHNFIRALVDPYPNAFVRCKDGKKLYLTGSHL